MEVLAEIPGHPGYWASDLGRVYSTRSGKFLKQQLHPDGYMCVGMGKAKSHKVHRLVLAAFRGDEPSLDGAHNNGVRHDNRLCNLEWKTRKENLADMDRHGTRPRGSSHPQAALSETQRQVVRDCWWVSPAEMGLRFGVNAETIRRARR